MAVSRSPVSRQRQSRQPRTCEKHQQPVRRREPADNGRRLQVHLRAITAIPPAAREVLIDPPSKLTMKLSPTPNFNPSDALGSTRLSFTIRTAGYTRFLAVPARLALSGDRLLAFFVQLVTLQAEFLSPVPLSRC